MYTIHITPRPSDPTMSRIDGERRALEALLPIFRTMRRAKLIGALPSRTRNVCNCAFDGPAVGLSTVHCFVCDGRGFHDTIWGTTLPSLELRDEFETRIRAAGFEIVREPFAETNTRWVP